MSITTLIEPARQNFWTKLFSRKQKSITLEQIPTIEEVRAGYQFEIADVELPKSEAQKFFKAIESYPGCYSYIWGFEDDIDYVNAEPQKVFVIDFFRTDPESEKTEELMKLVAKLGHLSTVHNRATGDNYHNILYTED